MDSRERLLRRIKGQPVDRPPNLDIMMTFAAHYIRKPLSQYYKDHRVLCDANLAVMEAFNLDVVQAISDPYREAADFGLNVVFPDDNLPLSTQPLVTEPSVLKQIKVPDPSIGRRMSDRIAAVARFHDQVGGSVPIMGWVEGALAEVADLRGVGNLMFDLYDSPEWVEEFLEICADVGVRFARAQVAAGADIIGLGDAIASQVSPAMYRRFALPYEKRIFAAVHEMGAICRLHICGNTTRILEDMVASGADIIDLDWMVDFSLAASTFGDRAAPCGNMDPVAIMRYGTQGKVREMTLKCLEAGGARAISAAGCEIPDGTPFQNLKAQAEMLVEFGKLQANGRLP